MLEKLKDRLGGREPGGRAAPEPPGDTVVYEDEDGTTVIEPGARDAQYMRQRPPTSREESAAHADYHGQNPNYEHDGGPGSLWDRANRLATTAPVHGNPTLDPAGTMMGPALMAGYDPGHQLGFDALRGPEEMVLGWRDANKELEVQSITPGGPLQMARFESIYEGDRPRTHDMGLSPEETGERVDWCAEMKLHEQEPEARDDDWGGDWCAWL